MMNIHHTNSDKLFTKNTWYNLAKIILVENFYILYYMISILNITDRGKPVYGKRLDKGFHMCINYVKR